MFFRFFILIIICVLNISCFHKKISSIEIEADYNSKDNTYTITYPEYNKVNSDAISLKLKKALKVKNGINLKYNISSDNTPVMLNIDVYEDSERKRFTIENPVVGRNINFTFYDTNFNPPLEKNKIKEVYISIESVGNYDTRDTVKISFNENNNEDYKTYIEGMALVLPRSGHVAKSNPPFMMFNRKATTIDVSIARDISFQNALKYRVRNNNSLYITNELEYGKWFIALDENSDTNTRKIYTFFINEESKKIAPIENRYFNIERPFIFLDATLFNNLKNIYLRGRIPPSTFLRNINNFKSYTDSHIGKWSLNNITFNSNDEDTSKLLFDNIPSHIMLVSLRTAFEATNNILIYDMKQIVKDIVNLEEGNLYGYSKEEATYILANSILMPFDILYDIFSPEEIVLMKQAFVKYGKTLYDYLISNAYKAADRNMIKYATTLGLISINMFNENYNQEDVRHWYYFSLNYINSMIFSLFEDDGSFRASIGEIFDIVLPIFIYANTLSYIDIFNPYTLDGFINFGKYLSIVGYPSGHTLPVGKTLIDSRTKLRFDSLSRSAIMELLSRNYNSIIYKNYATFGQSEVLNIKYLPYLIMWNNFNIRDNLNVNVYYQYETSYFKNIQTAIYNEDIMSFNKPYFALYAKGINVDSSYGLNHNDRMSFVYYNYGDNIIDELGYIADTTNNIGNANFHNTISISDNRTNYTITENIASYSYIESLTNYNKLFFAYAKSNPNFVYPIKLNNFDRRFYYLKPNILIIKENIEALPTLSTDKKYISSYKYNWRINSKNKIKLEDNIFIVDAPNSTTYINIISEYDLDYKVDENTVGNTTIYTALVSSKEYIRKFEPWIIVSTVPKDIIPIALRRNILDTNIDIVSFNSTNLTFKSGLKEYSINQLIKDENKEANNQNIIYTETRENVIINSY